ncbi:hypothetical protein F4775DRAFT_598152 [Biscogniauxia sp. FL1348]|nr:hypothetical protein F4775DRAFT_598152 [Biscogniauxia sp. FL1348]
MKAANSSWMAIGAQMLMNRTATNYTGLGCDLAMVPKDLETQIHKEAIMQHMKEFDRITHDAPSRHRMAGTQGGNATLDYIALQLSQVGYDVDVVPFHQNIQTRGTAQLVTQDPILGPMGVEHDDYPSSVQGQAALADGNGCSLSQKSATAKKAGAKVLVIYETTELQPSLGGVNSSHIATVKVPTVEVPRLLRAHSAASNLTANITVGTTIYTIGSANIIATTRCGDNHKTLVVGARSDTFQGSAGMNDNGSGVAALLETAIQLVKYRMDHKVTFAFWTAGHSGNLGSQAWVDSASKSDLKKIKLYLDANMLGSANGFTQIYGAGAGALGRGQDESEHAQGLLRDWFASQGLGTKGANFSGRGDYQPFVDAGVPATGLFAGANGIKTAEEQRLSKNANGTAGLPYDPTYRSALDVINMVDQDLLYENTRALAHLVAAYAADSDPGSAPVPVAAAGRAGVLGFSVAAAVALGWLVCWLGM